MYSEPTDKLRILVIDDDPVFREIITAHAELAGYETDSAADWEEAKLKLNDAALSNRPFLAVTIDMMFEMGAQKIQVRRGREILQYIKKDYPQIACVMITGSDGVSARDVLNWRDQDDLGAFLLKTEVDHESLRNEVERALRLVKPLEPSPVGQAANEPRIFISYRRKGAISAAKLLFERLKEAFGADPIFMDLEKIEFGDRFDDVLRDQISGCTVMLVVIYEDWAIVTDDYGELRLHDPEDYVRLEIATALADGKRVIPILINGATLPAADSLPDDLKDLPKHQCFELRHTHFDSDMNDLINALNRISGR